MKLVRIRKAKPLGNYRVELTLTDGRVVERDLGPMLVGPVFSEIRSGKRSSQPRYGSLPGVNTTGIALGCIVHSKQSPPPWRCSRHSAAQRNARKSMRNW
jgi:hypothetical protein